MEATKLVGTGRQGDFVHAGQEMAAKQDFRNVSKLWYDKTKSYDEIREELQSHYDRRVDVESPLSGFKPVASDTGVKFVAQGGPNDGAEYTMTPHALNQYLLKIDVPITVANDLLNPKLNPNGKEKFARDHLDRELFVAYINNGLRHFHQRVNDKKFLFRTYDDTKQINAVLTDRYSCVDNRWFLEIVNELIPGGRYSHFKRADDNTLFGNVLIPDSIREEDDSDYGGMLSLSNCEIGRRRLSQRPSIFRAICMNGNIWDQSNGVKFSKRHIGIDDLDGLKKDIVANLNIQIPLAHDGIERLLSTRAEEYKVPGVKVQKIFVAIADAFKLTPKQLLLTADQFAQHEKGHRNLFGIINAVTRAGQYCDNDEWVKMDEIGGELTKWTPQAFASFCQRADSYTEEDLAKRYGSDKALLSTIGSLQAV